MKEHFATGGTRALWVSTSRDLGFDALRDLQDVHADIDIHPKVSSLAASGLVCPHAEQCQATTADREWTCRGTQACRRGA